MLSKDQEKDLTSDQVILKIQQNPQVDEAQNQNSQVQKLSPLGDELKQQFIELSELIIQKQLLEEEIRFKEEQKKSLPEFENYVKIFQNQQPQLIEQNTSIKNQTSPQKGLQVKSTVNQQKKDFQIQELQKQSSSNLALLQELVNMGFEVQKAELAIELSEAIQVEQALGFLTKDQDG